MMKKNIKCILAYSGTHYFGWQKTKMGPSIEETVENVLKKILLHPTPLQAASRTDRGVHAEGQVINFFTEKKSLNLHQLQASLRSLLPRDISPVKLDFAPEGFHPTLDAQSKWYCYHICNNSIQLPFHREFSWHVPYPLNLDLMEQGAKILEGTHDFSSLTNRRSEDCIRTVSKIEIRKEINNRLSIHVKGNHFLYKMVRNIVGTLVYIGCSKILVKELPSILKSKNRSLTGVTAPAHGLILKEVFY